jgi:hypothetical protein
LQVAALHEEGEIVLCVYQHPKGAVIYPFVLRPMPFGLDGHDIITPYEYGGPLVRAADAQAVRADFREAFAGYCHSRGVVSEFVRFNPLLRNQEGWGGFYELRKCGDNVVIDLSKDEDAILAGYRSGTRYNMRAACKRGAQVEQADKTSANSRLFADMYRRAMDRVGAAPFYYFSNAYFERLVSLDDDLVSLYFARDGDGKVISAALFLHGQEYVHYHLSATVAGVNRLSPGSLLLHNAVLDMRRKGKKYFHLGGAAADQEGLHRFKRGFSGDRKEYYVGRRVQDPLRYEAAQASWNAANPGKAGRALTDYFPGYRWI